MAAKATMRNGRPLVVAISTNDALGLNAQNLAKLLAAKNVYFVPFGQEIRQRRSRILSYREWNSYRRRAGKPCMENKFNR